MYMYIKKWNNKYSNNLTRNTSLIVLPVIIIIHRLKNNNTD